MHGYLASKECFYKNIYYLKKYFNVYAFDFKGFGENKNMEYPYSLDDYVNELKDYIEKNNIKKPSIVAHSFGARVVIKVASKEPNLFDKIVLTGPAGLKPKFSIKKAIKKYIFKLLKNFIKKEKLTAFYSKDYQQLTPVMKESFNKIVNEHLDEKVFKVINETLLIFGNKDRETPLYMAKKLHKKLPHNKLVIIKNAGHFAFLEKADEFNKEVKDFLI